MATHDDRDMDAIRTLVNVVEHLRASVPQNYDALISGAGELSLFTPVLVLSGSLAEVRSESDELSLEPIEHVRLRHVHIHQGRPRAYSIEVVTEQHLPTLLEIIDSDFRETATRFEASYREALHDVGFEK